MVGRPARQDWVARLALAVAVVFLAPPGRPPFGVSVATVETVEPAGAGATARPVQPVLAERLLAKPLALD
jgi:hypothetical protein